MKTITKSVFQRFNGQSEFGIFDPENKRLSFCSFMNLVEFINAGYGECVEEWEIAYMWPTRRVVIMYTWDPKTHKTQAGSTVTMTKIEPDKDGKQSVRTKVYRPSAVAVETLLDMWRKVPAHRKDMTLMGKCSAIYTFTI